MGRHLRHLVEAAVVGALVAVTAKRLLRPVDWTGLDGTVQPSGWDAFWGHLGVPEE